VNLPFSFTRQAITPSSSSLPAEQHPAHWALLPVPEVGILLGLSSFMVRLKLVVHLPGRDGLRR